MVKNIDSKDLNLNDSIFKRKYIQSIKQYNVAIKVFLKPTKFCCIVTDSKLTCASDNQVSTKTFACEFIATVDSFCLYLC